MSRPVRFRFLTPRELRATSDDQARPAARPRYVRLRPAIHRLLSPRARNHVRFQKPLGATIGTPLPLRPRVLPDHGALAVIQNPEIAAFVAHAPAAHFSRLYRKCRRSTPAFAPAASRRALPIKISRDTTKCRLSRLPLTFSAQSRRCGVKETLRSGQRYFWFVRSASGAAPMPLRARLVDQQPGTHAVLRLKILSALRGPSTQHDGLLAKSLFVTT
jgi:hypothetical protein